MYYYPLSSLRVATICGAAPWAAAGLSGRPVRAPGFAKVASMPAWEAGAAQGVAPPDGAHGIVQALGHFAACCYVGQASACGGGFGPPPPRSYQAPPPERKPPPAE